MRNDGPVDWARVAELKAEFGADGFAEVLNLFLEETDAVAAEIARGLADGLVEQKLHFLKGSALNLGLTDLATLCSDGERLAAAARNGEVDLPSVVETYRKARETLMEGLEDRDAA